MGRIRESFPQWRLFLVESVELGVVGRGVKDEAQRFISVGAKLCQKPEYAYYRGH